MVTGVVGFASSLFGFVLQRGSVVDACRDGSGDGAEAGFPVPKSVVTSMAGFETAPSVARRLAGFEAVRRPHPPGGRTSIPTAFR